jgi:hypothetical protein
MRFMKRIIQIIAAMAVIISMTGCVTPYLTDRVYDAADVFTVAVSGGGGAKARVGPVHTGLIIDIGSYGIRSGEFGEQG